MTDITFELVDQAGTDVAFDLVAEAGTDLTFELLPGGGSGVSLPISSDDVDVEGTAYDLTTVLTSLGTSIVGVSTTLGGQITVLQGTAIDLATADGVETAARIAADAALAATDATTTGNLTSLTTYVDVIEARLRMVAQANRVAAPTLWAVGGGEGAVWEADWQAPNPTSTFEVEAWVKVLDAREPGFIEIAAESIDGEGDLDRFEVADWYADEDENGFIEGVHGYAEGTRAGEDVEYHRPGEGHTQLDSSALSPIVPGIWVRRLWVYDFDAHTITTYVEDDLYWHIERYGRRWVPIGTYANPIIDSLRATEGYPTWLIRGVGDHLLAYEAIYVDGVEVQRFDPSTATIGDTTVDDSVASGITWTGSGTGAEIDGVTASGGGAVDSVNGQTGTVVLDADDISDGTTNKAYTATEKTKLAGIATGATATETWAVNINCTTNPHATVGTTPTVAADSGSIGGGYLSSANATGSGATFKRYLSAGTYDIKLRARNLGVSSGRGEVLIDGVSKGYFDTSVSSARNVEHTVATGVTLTAGVHEITVASYDKGTGATSWTVFVQTIDLIRTA